MIKTQEEQLAQDPHVFENIDGISNGFEALPDESSIGGDSLEASISFDLEDDSEEQPPPVVSNNFKLPAQRHSLNSSTSATTAIEMTRVARKIDADENRVEQGKQCQEMLSPTDGQIRVVYNKDNRAGSEFGSASQCTQEDSSSHIGRSSA